MLEPRESFTIDELMEIFDHAGCPVVGLGLGEDSDGSKVYLAPEDEKIPWVAILGAEQPFYEWMLLSVIETIQPATDHYRFSSEWNKNHHHSQMWVEEEIAEDDDETIVTSVVLGKSLFFFGGITADYLGYLIYMFHDDVSEALEVVAELETMPRLDAVADVRGPIGVDSSAEGFPAALHSYLANVPGTSAREIARALGVPKHEVNHVLYKNPDLFALEAGQPPRWRIR